MNNTDCGWGQYVSIDFDDFDVHSETSNLPLDINNGADRKSNKPHYFQRLLSLSFRKTILYLILAICLSIYLRYV
jgi:hypothetical protein